MRLITALFFLAICAGLHAQSYDNLTTFTTPDWFGRRMAHKWERGVVNTFTGVAEIPAQSIKGYERGLDPFNKGVAVKPTGAVVGVFRGVGHAVGRTTYGVWEMLTFWAANPADNNMVGTPFDSEFAWETTQPVLSKEEMAMTWYQPMGNKLERGAKNFAFGGSEFAYQWTHGDENTSVQAIGENVGRGFYMFVSRELNGIFDMATFLLPNPREQVGVTYDTPDPWNQMHRVEAKGKKLEDLLKEDAE